MSRRHRPTPCRPPWCWRCSRSALAGCATDAAAAGRAAAAAGDADAAAGLPAAGPRRALGAYRLSQGGRPRAHRGRRRQPMHATPMSSRSGPTGGVMMHLADQATPTELRLKGAPGGKTYIGPQGEPPGSTQDREVVTFDGRVLILRWMDPEVQGRYGTMVYVRCAPEGAKQAQGRAARPSRSRRPKPKPKPAAEAGVQTGQPKPMRSRPVTRMTIAAWRDASAGMTRRHWRCHDRSPRLHRTAPGARCRCSASRKFCPGARSSTRRC